MSTTVIVLIVVAVLIVLWLVGAYNSLVRLRNNRENAFANIDVQLQQRYDLLLHIAGNLHDIAAVHDIDNDVNDDLPVDKLHLDSLVDGLEADQLRKLRAGGIREPGNALDFTDGGFDNAGDNLFRNIDTAFFHLAADIILAHDEPPK